MSPQWISHCQDEDRQERRRLFWIAVRPLIVIGTLLFLIAAGFVAIV